jgi:hypothetical protein
MSCNDCQSCEPSTPTKPCGRRSFCKKQKSTKCCDIPHRVVETYSEVQDYRNAYVTVRDENAVYHVDKSGNPVAVSRSAIFIDDYTPQMNDYRQNIVYDFINNKAYIYNPVGLYRTIDLS